MWSGQKEPTAEPSPVKRRVSVTLPAHSTPQVDSSLVRVTLHEETGRNVLYDTHALGPATALEPDDYLQVGHRSRSNSNARSRSRSGSNASGQQGAQAALHLHGDTLADILFGTLPLNAPALDTKLHVLDDHMIVTLVFATRASTRSSVASEDALVFTATPPRRSTSTDSIQRSISGSGSGSGSRPHVEQGAVDAVSRKSVTSLLSETSSVHSTDSIHGYDSRSLGGASVQSMASAMDSPAPSSHASSLQSSPTHLLPRAEPRELVASGAFLDEQHHMRSMRSQLNTMQSGTPRLCPNKFRRL